MFADPHHGVFSGAAVIERVTAQLISKRKEIKDYFMYMRRPELANLISDGGFVQERLGRYICINDAVLARLLTHFNIRFDLIPSRIAPYEFFAAVDAAVLSGFSGCDFRLQSPGFFKSPDMRARGYFF